MKRSNPYKAVIPLVSGIAYVPNPRMVPHVPIEVAVRSERIGTQGRDLAPGVRLISQVSRAEKEVWVTHGEQRLFVYVEDDQGRGSYFYQSFAGTGGKQQGFWFPSGGVMADQRGRGAWVIKGNPKTDPGAGRAALLELYERVNQALPQSDADTDRFVKRLTGQDYGDLTYKDEYEVKPTIRITEPGNANELQKKWGSWCYQFWALNALDKTFGKRTFNMKTNPTDLAGRHIPERYLAGLPTKLQQQRVRELTYSRDAYRRGDYSELPTDRIARAMGLVKESAYTAVAKRRGIEYTGGFGNMAMRVLRFYGGRNASREEIERLSGALSASFKKGLAAWKSGGHRPGATAQNWAVARVNSLVVGGKTAWTADKKQFASIPEAIRRVIASQIPEVIDALQAQGRKKDVAFLSSRVRSNPLTTPEDRNVLWMNFYRTSRAPLLRQAKYELAKLKVLDDTLAEELVQEAQLEAVAKASERVDSPDDFERVQQLMNNMASLYIRKNAYKSLEATTAPSDLYHARARIKAARQEFQRIKGRQPSLRELAEKLETRRGPSITPDEIRAIEIEGRPPVLFSLDYVAPERAAEKTLHEAWSTQSGEYAIPLTEDPVASLVSKEARYLAKRLIGIALSFLTPREKEILQTAESEQPRWSLEGMTAEQARSALQRIRGRLRRAVELQRSLDDATAALRSTALQLGVPMETVTSALTDEKVRASLPGPVLNAVDVLSESEQLLRDLERDREERREKEKQRIPELVRVRENRR
jgi:hypothetical protein